MIPRLDDLSLAARIAIIIAVVVLALLVLAAVGYFGSEEAQGEPSRSAALTMPITKHEEQLLALDRAALADAYRDQIHHLFTVWMKDETGQPARAVVGARKARKAFDDAMTGLDLREQIIKQHEQKQ